MTVEGPLVIESVDMSDNAGGEGLAEEEEFPTFTFRGASDDDDADDDDDREEPPLKKTKSQIAKALKVERVAQSVEKRREPVYGLSRTVSHLAKSVVPNEISAIEAELEAVDRARKHARNFGEDLVEDMLALDGLGALSSEDRNTRKAAISGIEALLEDVDAAKARLATLHKSLESKLQESKKAMAAEDAKHARQAEASRAEESIVTAEPSDTQAAKELRLPGKDAWRKLRLPLRFHSIEHRDHYLLTATLPGLDPDDVKLELGDDAATLTVAGLRVPSRTDEALMRQRIAARFADMARRAPHRLQDLGAEAVASAYLELGEGKFGRFSETFHMPEDANANGVKASYHRDGVLRVVLPKKAQYALPRRSGLDRGYGPGSSFRGAGGGDPRRGQHAAARGQTPSVPRGGMPFFGGHDDSFWW